MLPKENQPLAPLTTFGIGGPARWFVDATSEQDVSEAAAWAQERNIALLVLGGGSNLLVSDAGFNGLVLHIALRGIEAETSEPDSGQPGSQVYRVAAGEDWDSFVSRTVTDNCAGVECLAGIPGTVGGTPAQNVGAYGQEVATVIDRVRAFDLESRAFVEFTAAECDFSYRRSRFNSSDRGSFVVTRVDYRLMPGGPPTVSYPDLRKAIEAHRTHAAGPTLIEVADVVRQVRRAKGMLLVESDPDCRSAGSFFKNPVVAVEVFRQIAAQRPNAPHYPAGPELVKIPAAWLIEQAGFTKGFARGPAAISSKHTLALVNRGEQGRSATANEVLALAAEIAAAVEVRFGIRLEREPVLLGF